MPQAPVKLPHAVSPRQPHTGKNWMESIPLELFQSIWRFADTSVPRNVPVSCRRIGNSFEIYSTETISNITALSVHRRSREWTRTENHVATLLRHEGYKQSFNHIKSLHFNPKRDRVCPINESEWTPEAFKLFCWVMKAAKVERIAISDFSHLQLAPNNPWSSFWRWHNTVNWSPSFADILMYTTKNNLGIHQSVKFIEWAIVNLNIDRLQMQRRNAQIHHAQVSLQRIKDAKERQTEADNEAQRDGKLRTKLDDVPTWLYEDLQKRRNFYPRMMVEIGSLEVQNGNSMNDSSNDDDNTHPENNVDDEETDVDEEPEEDEGIEDEDSDDYNEDNDGE